MTKRIVLLAVLSLVGATLLNGVVSAEDKSDICHRKGDGSYHLISVSEEAVAAHRAHGDGLPGEPFPGMEGKVFGDDCNPEDAGLSGYEVVTSPPLVFGDGGYGGWSCPAGKVVTGGGFDATDPVAVSAPGTPGSVWPHYTFGADEYGWVVRDDPDGSGNTITVYAICANTT